MFDFSLTGCSALVNDALSFPLKGSFFATTGNNKNQKNNKYQSIPLPGVEPPFPPQPFPLDTGIFSGSDIQLCFGEYVFNSLAWTFYQNDVLMGRITPQELPPDSPLQLNTSNILVKQISPGLCTEYPDSAVIVDVFGSALYSNTTSPTFTIAGDGVTINAAVNIHVSALIPNGGSSKYHLSLLSIVFLAYPSFSLFFVLSFQIRIAPTIPR